MSTKVKILIWAFENVLRVNCCALVPPGTDLQSCPWHHAGGLLNSTVLRQKSCNTDIKIKQKNEPEVSHSVNSNSFTDFLPANWTRLTPTAQVLIFPYILISSVVERRTFPGKGIIPQNPKEEIFEDFQDFLVLSSTFWPLWKFPFVLTNRVKWNEQHVLSSNIHLIKNETFFLLHAHYCL